MYRNSLSINITITLYKAIIHGINILFLVDISYTRSYLYSFYIQTPPVLLNYATTFRSPCIRLMICCRSCPEAEYSTYVLTGRSRGSECEMKNNWTGEPMASQCLHFGARSGRARSSFGLFVVSAVRRRTQPASCEETRSRCPANGLPNVILT